ncbi:MAG: 30S ribosomal protein S9 [Saprospiraceae bacterium]|nr:30S ribosomal protein S9 [Saprospiraceae bacterium]
METIINAVGRRKAAVARVYLFKAVSSTPSILINGRNLDQYFPIKELAAKVTDPINTVETGKNYDVKITVNGGGLKGQAEAIRMGISRALVKANADDRKPLKEKKFLTRDAREVERKKFGKRKARRSTQFSKR